MHEHDVKRVPLGKVNAYLIIFDQEAILVDTGTAGCSGRVQKALAEYELGLQDLKLIFITHTHYDHTGSAAELRRKSGAPLLVQEKEAEALRRGVSLMPAGATPLGRTLVSAVSLLGKKEGSFEAVEPDYTFAEEYDLMPFGFPGKVFHTPGHSEGSACLIGEENGDCFVGDTLFGIWPRRVMPPFADLPELLPESWRVMLEHGAQYFFPGHGRSFGRERLLQEIWRSERSRAAS
jgi:glyoxylase-like metal-dependent hydrolase (beta-lactamase superfamily II)